MFSRRKKNHSKEIIDWFYTQEFDPKIEARLKDLFTLWLTDQEIDTEKEEALDLLIKRELLAENIHTIDSTELKEAFKQLIERVKEQPTANTTHHKSKIKQSSLQKRLLTYAAIIIPVTILLGSWIVINNIINIEYQQEWITAQDKTENITLPDSTHITIDSDTRLNVVLNKVERVVKLSGAGYFRVAKDQKRPFEVIANDLTVRVLGTEFNIEAYPEEPLTIVTLTKGKVSLTSASSGDSWELVPGQMFLYDNESGDGRTLNLTPEEVADISDGRGGSGIESKYRTLADLFKLIEHRYAIEIIIDASIDLFNNEYLIQINPDDTPEMILDALEVLTDEFSYQVKDNVYYINAPSKALKN